MSQPQEVVRRLGRDEAGRDLRPHRRRREAQRPLRTRLRDLPPPAVGDSPAEHAEAGGLGRGRHRHEALVPRQPRAVAADDLRRVDAVIPPLHRGDGVRRDVVHDDASDHVPSASAEAPLRVTAVTPGPRPPRGRDGRPRGSRRASWAAPTARMTLSSISGVKGKALAMAPSMTTLAALTVPAWAASALASTARTLGQAAAIRSSMPSGYSAGAGRDGARVHAGGVVDQQAARLEPVHVAQGLHRLEREEHVGGAGRDERRVDLVAEAQVAGHAAAALGHAVDLALLDVVALGQGDAAEHVAGEHHALAADARDAGC